MRPPQSSGLAQVNQWRGDVSGDVTQNFTLAAGHRLDLDVTVAGAVYTQQLPLDIVPLVDVLPDGKWYTLDWDQAAYHYAATLPSDIYHITVRDVPSGYYDTAHSYDLRPAQRYLSPASCWSTCTAPTRAIPSPRRTAVSAPASMPHRARP